VLYSCNHTSTVGVKGLATHHVIQLLCSDKLDQLYVHVLTVELL